MTYEIFPTSRFKNDYKTAIKRGYNPDLLDEVVTTLSEGKQLAKKYCDHDLSGKYTGCRECHITPDWLLIYGIADDELVLYLMRTGTHSDLF